MASLLSAAAQLTTGTSIEVTGPCTVYSRGVHMGAPAFLEMSRADTAALFEIEHMFLRPGQYKIEADGTYFLRGRTGTGGVSTAITMDTEQDA